MTPVVSLDTELLVHRVPSPLRCGGGVAVWEPISPRAEHGTVLKVRRCTLLPKHTGGHEYEVAASDRYGSQRSTCGLIVDEFTWISWDPSEGDPLCPACHGVDEGEQEALL